jgi:hypothetical protein
MVTNPLGHFSHFWGLSNGCMSSAPDEWSQLNEADTGLGTNGKLLIEALRLVIVDENEIAVIREAFKRSLHLFIHI